MASRELTAAEEEQRGVMYRNTLKKQRIYQAELENYKQRPLEVSDKLNRFTHSIDFHSNRLTKLEISYNKGKDDLLLKYQEALSKLEQSYETEKADISSKLQTATQNAEKEKEHLQQQRKPKMLIKAEIELSHAIEEYKRWWGTVPSSFVTLESTSNTVPEQPVAPPAPPAIPEPPKEQPPPSNTIPEPPAATGRSFNSEAEMIRAIEKEMREEKKAKEKKEEVSDFEKVMRQKAIEREKAAQEAAAKMLEDKEDDSSSDSGSEISFDEEEIRRAAEAQKAANKKKHEDRMRMYYTPPAPEVLELPKILSNTKTKKPIKMVK